MEKFGEFLSGLFLVVFFFGFSGWMLSVYLSDPLAYSGVKTYAVVFAAFGVFFLWKLARYVREEFLGW